MAVDGSTWQRAENAFQAGDLAMAERICRSLLGSRYEHPGVHWMLSRIYQEAGGFRLAARHANLAAANAASLPLKPRLAITSGLISVGDYEAAARILRGALEGGAREPELIGEAIRQLASLDEHGPVTAWLAEVARLGVRSSELSFLRGNNCKFRGEIAEAAAAYEDAIALSPGNPHPHLALATLSLDHGGASRIDRIRQCLKSAARSDECVLHYALFRELDGLGEVDAAWDALSNGMRRKRAEVGHDRPMEDAIFDRMIDGYNERYVSVSSEAPVDRVPIFIVGMPRTGTTLVERILGGHHQVAACGELSDLRMAYKRATDHYCHAFLDLEAANRLSQVDAAGLAVAYRERTRWKGAQQRWFIDKHPGNFILSGLILRAMPEAKVINVRREAVDSCFANLRELFARHYYEYSYDIDDVANHYRNYDRLMRHLSEVAPGRILDVDYESLVRAPEQMASRILEFCGLDSQAGITDVVANRQPVSSASSIQVRQPIHDRRLGYWKKYAGHLQPLVARLGTMGCLS